MQSEFVFFRNTQPQFAPTNQQLTFYTKLHTLWFSGKIVNLAKLLRVSLGVALVMKSNTSWWPLCVCSRTWSGSQVLSVCRSYPQCPVVSSLGNCADKVLTYLRRLLQNKTVWSYVRMERFKRFSSQYISKSVICSANFISVTRLKYTVGRYICYSQSVKPV